MGWTQDQVNTFNARRLPKSAIVTGCDRESALHDQILEECRRSGWLAIHSRMDLASTSTVGSPDFIILANEGQMFLIECKSRTGKISLKQAALHAQAKHLGHSVFTVRSFEEFLELIK